MKVITLRKWHRRIGVILAPMVILQVVTGITLSTPVIYNAQEQVHSTLVEKKMSSLSQFWKFLFVDGHTGGGIFGMWYTVLIGCGLVFIVLSGTLIFLAIRQRMILSAARKAIPGAIDSHSDPPHDISGQDLIRECRQIMTFNWRVYAVLAVGLVLGCVIASYINFLAYRISSRDTALSMTVSELTLQTIRAHLEQEEILGGSLNDGMERVNARMGKADQYSKALVHGGVTNLGALLPPSDPAFLDKYKTLRRVFLEFKNLSETRGAMPSAAAQEVGIVTAYDNTYTEFLVHAEDVKNSVHESYLQDIHAFRSKFALFLSLSALLVALTAIVIYKLEKFRTNVLRGGSRDSKPV